MELFLYFIFLLQFILISSTSNKEAANVPSQLSDRYLQIIDRISESEENTDHLRSYLTSQYKRRNRTTVNKEDVLKKPKPQHDDPSMLFADCVNKFDYSVEQFEYLKHEKRSLQKELHYLKLKLEELKELNNIKESEIHELRNNNDIVKDQSYKNGLLECGRLIDQQGEVDCLYELNSCKTNSTSLRYKVQKLDTELTLCKLNATNTQTLLNICSGGQIPKQQSIKCPPSSCGECTKELTTCKEQAMTELHNLNSKLVICEKNSGKNVGNLDICNNELTTCKNQASHAMGTKSSCDTELQSCKHTITENVITLKQCTENLNKNKELEICNNNNTNLKIEIERLNNELQNYNNQPDILNQLNTCNENLKICELSAETIHVADREVLIDCELHSLKNNEIIQYLNTSLENCLKDNSLTLNTSNVALNICNNNLGQIQLLESQLTNYNLCKVNLSLTTRDFETCKNDLTLCKTNIIEVKETVSSLNNNITVCEHKNNFVNEHINTCKGDLNICNANAKETVEKMKVMKEQLDKCTTKTMLEIDTQNSCNLELQNCQTASNDNNLRAENCTQFVTSLKSECGAKIAPLLLEKSPTLRIYHFMNDINKAKTWHGALTYCRSYNMDLVSLETAGENSWIKSKLQYFGEKLDLINQNDLFYWTSLNNQEDVSTWLWGGSGRGTLHFDWGISTNMPSDTTKNRCVGFNRSDLQMYWQNEDCNKKARFICEVRDPCLSLLL